MSKEIGFKNRDRFIQLGITISVLRKMRGMSQEQLAAEAMMSRSHLSAIEAPNIVRPFSVEEKKHLEGELQKARMRTETVSRLYKKAFEKNAEGLLSDEGFLQITHEYDVEQLALKAKIPQLREQIAEAERQAANKDKFIAAIRKFMQMDELTAPLLRELIDHIEVYETQGVGKSRTQRITIHYRFVGYIDIPAAPLTSHYISETRQGVAVEYIPA